MRQIRQHSPTLRENSEKLDVDGKIRTLSALDIKVTAIQGKFSIEISVDPRIKFRQMEPSHSSCLRLLKTGRAQKETVKSQDVVWEIINLFVLSSRSRLRELHLRQCFVVSR